MLLIRQAQWDELESAACEELVVRAVEKLPEKSPASIIALTEAERQERLTIALRKITSYRFETGREVQAFVRLVFEIGPNFDEYPPFAKILRGTDGPNDIRVPALFQQASSDDWVQAAIHDVVSRSRNSLPGTKPQIRSVSLLRLIREHGEAYFREALHPDVWRLGGMMPLGSVAEADAHIATLEGDSIVSNAIIDAAYGFLGAIAAWKNQDGVNLCYWVGRRFWGLGVATTAVRHQLQQLGDYTPIIATVAAGNAPSIRVLMKCGFELITQTKIDNMVTLQFVQNHGST